MTIERYKGGRHWGVYNAHGELIVVCLYKKGAQQVVDTILGLCDFIDPEVRMQNGI